MDFFHVEQIYDAVKISARSDRNFKCNRCAFEFFLHVFHCSVEVCANSIHFVYKTNARNFEFIRLLPDRLRLRLNPPHCANYRHRAVKHTKAALNFRSKVNMARRVDDVDLISAPVSGDCRRCDGNAALLLLLHEVHR